MDLPPGSLEAWNLNITAAVFGAQEEIAAEKGGPRPAQSGSELKRVLEANHVPEEERFASVSGRPMKKMKVPKSGVW
jgi:hypothetical protein